MTTSGTVKAIGIDQSWGQEFRVVTVELRRGGEVRLRFKPHEARAYHLGRTVEVMVQPRKER